MANVYEMVNERIIAELEKGVVPWQRPWTGIRGGAYSRSTGKPYSLLNQMLLGKPGEYLTFNQCLEAGGHVRKGEKSRFIVFWKQLHASETNDMGEPLEKTIPYLRYIRVFHIDQCEGIEPKYLPEELPPFNPIEEADKLISAYFKRSGCRIRHERQNEAYYTPSLDRITMPLQEQFPVPANYYGTLFHEVAHSTGHSQRLARFDTTQAFGKELYSKEELVAELVAFALLNTLGIETNATFRNNVAYIQSWLSVLKNDTKLLVGAAGKAEKALAMIMGDEAIAAVHCAESEEPATPKQPVARPAKRTPIEKAALSFAKHCVSSGKGAAPAIPGAVVRNGRQFLSDGYVAVAYETPIEDLVMAATIPEARLAKLEQSFTVSRIGNPLRLPPLKEIKAQYKAAKGKSRNFTQLTKLDDTYIDTSYLIRAMELAGISDGMAVCASPVKPLYIKGVGCEVLVIPVRVNDGSRLDTWTPELSA